MDEMAQNLQSEFSQIIREVIGLTILRFVRSPISKECEERNEAILRKILVRQVEPQEARQFLKELEQRYPKSKRQECPGKLIAKSLEEISYEGDKTA
jgi:hypothetical protein